MRAVLQVAHEVRSRVLGRDRKLKQRDVYTLCFHLARELRSRFPDICIIVGDRAVEHGFAQHLWLESATAQIFVDAAFDDNDPFHPVRAGKTTDADFISLYRNGQDANFDLDDPRNRPEMLYRSRTG